MKKYLTMFMSMVIIASLLAACGTKTEITNETGGEKTDKAKVLTMGTSADYPPFEYIDTAKSDEIIGLDVDLAKAIGEKLGYEIKVLDMDFNGLIPSVQAGKVDFVMAGMSPNEEREKVVDFTLPYYETVFTIITKKDSGIKTAEDLKGKTLGAQVGSFQEEKALELQKTIDMKVENRNRIPELIQEIKSKRFDAAIVEEAAAVGFLKENADLAGFNLTEGAKNEKVAIFPKDSEVKEEFDKVIKEMSENGELEKLTNKWFNSESK